MTYLKLLQGFMRIHNLLYQCCSDCKRTADVIWKHQLGNSKLSYSNLTKLAC